MNITDIISQTKVGSLHPSYTVEDMNTFNHVVRKISVNNWITTSTNRVAFAKDIGGPLPELIVCDLVDNTLFVPQGELAHAIGRNGNHINSLSKIVGTNIKVRPSNSYGDTRIPKGFIDEV